MTQYNPSANAGMGAGSGHPDPDTDEIRVEIAQTRTEMSGTIDAIQQRLAPETLTEQAKDVARDAAEQAKVAAQAVIEQAVHDVKDAALEVTEHAVHEVKAAAREATVDAKDAAWDATVGRAEHAVSSAGETAKGIRSTVIDTIKQNPIPATLAGLSLFWLYRNRQSGQHGDNRSRVPSDVRTSSNGQPRAASAYSVRTGYARGQGAWDASGSDLEQTASPRYGASPIGADGERYGAESGGITDTISRAASTAAGGAGQMAGSAVSGAENLATSAGQVASGAGESVMDAGSSLVQLVKRNPVPAALVSIGLGWLYANRSDGGRDYRADGDYRGYGSATNGFGRSSVRTDGASTGASGLMSRGADAAGDFADDVRERAGDAADAIGDAASSVGEHVGEMAGSVADRTRRAPGQLQHMIEESPLMAATLAASLGGVIGLSLPSTETEDRIVGTTRDRAVGRIQQVKSEAIDKVGEVAQEVKGVAEKEAREQGLKV